MADAGSSGLVEAAEHSWSPTTPAPRGQYTPRARAAPDDGKLWLGLARALWRVQGNDGAESAALNRDATSAAWNAYQLLRTTPARGDVLAVIAVGLDRRDLSGRRCRPSKRASRWSMPHRCGPNTRI